MVPTEHRDPFSGHIKGRSDVNGQGVDDPPSPTVTITGCRRGSDLYTGIGLLSVAVHLPVRDGRFWTRVTPTEGTTMFSPSLTHCERYEVLGAPYSDDTLRSTLV